MTLVFDSHVHEETLHFPLKQNNNRPCLVQMNNFCFTFHLACKDLAKICEKTIIIGIKGLLVK